MSANFRHSWQASTAEPTAPAHVPAARREPQPPAPCRINWRVARLASRSCCCTARPGVIAVMPPTPGRPHQTELLLCWHHYRISQVALAAAGAAMLTMDGSPTSGSAWQPPATDQR